MKHLKNIVRPYIVWAAVMIVIPLLLTILYAFTIDGNNLVNIKFTLDNFKRFSDPVYGSVFVKSFLLGIYTTIICFLLGYPLAYGITKFKESVQNILILFVTIPMWINMLLRTYAWISILSQNGLLNKLFNIIGLKSIDIMYTDAAVLIGLVCNFLPLMVIPIHTSLCKMDKTLIEAAQDLGANEVATFTKVTLPLSVPGIISGVTMVFLPAMTNYVVLDMLNNSTYIMGSLIGSYFHAYNWNSGSMIAIILLIIIFIVTWLTNGFEDNNENRGAVL